MADLTANEPARLDASDLMFRSPSTTLAEAATTFTPPSKEFLMGTWRVTHSTLDMWKSNRNITITYKPLDSPPGAVDDLVEYQPLKSDKQKSVRGVDTPDPEISAKYNWRGRGWLMIASSKWEVLAYGSEDGGWAVTYFAKTLFTKAGIDVYARNKTGVSKELLEKIKTEIRKIDDQNVRVMADQMFEIQHD